MSDLKLPQSEVEFMQLISTKNSRERQRMAAGLAHTHKDDPQLTALLRELLSTEVCCDKIPIKNPGSGQSPGSRQQIFFFLSLASICSVLFFFFFFFQHDESAVKGFIWIP